MASSFSLSRSASLGGPRKRDPYGNHIDDVERALGGAGELGGVVGSPGGASSSGGGTWSDGGHSMGSSYQDSSSYGGGGGLGGGGGPGASYAAYGRTGLSSSNTSSHHPPPSSPGHLGSSFPGGQQHQHQQRVVGELYPSSMTSEGLLRTGMLPLTNQQGPPPLPPPGHTSRSSYHGGGGGGAPPPSPSSYQAAKLAHQAQSPHLPTSHGFPSSPSSFGGPTAQHHSHHQHRQSVPALKYSTGGSGPPLPPAPSTTGNPYIPQSPSHQPPPPPPPPPASQQQQPPASHGMTYSYSGNSNSGTSPTYAGSPTTTTAGGGGSTWAEYSPRATPQVDMRSSPQPPPSNGPHQALYPNSNQQQGQGYTPPSSVGSPSSRMSYAPQGGSSSSSNPYLPPPPPSGQPPPPQAQQSSSSYQQPPPPPPLQTRPSSSGSTSMYDFPQFTSQPHIPGHGGMGQGQGHQVAQSLYAPHSRDGRTAGGGGGGGIEEGFRRVDPREDVRGRVGRSSAMVRSPLPPSLLSLSLSLFSVWNLTSSLFCSNGVAASPGSAHLPPSADVHPNKPVFPV